MIGAFQIFTQAYVMTRGGPNFATYFYVLHVYEEAFVKFRMGYASAMAWILFVAVLLVTLVQFRIAGRWVYYEAGD
jgi:multiple sugar transport system permease protein